MAVYTLTQSRPKGRGFQPIFLMTISPLPQYLENAFDLKQHLQDFLGLDSEKLEFRLAQSKQQLAELGHRDFDWAQTQEFYREQVGDIYLFELAAWHLSSREYIGDTIRLIADYGRGRLLDFGGGIGTQAIAAALCPQIERVIYCDLNPINQKFVQYRCQRLGLTDKIECCTTLPSGKFDTIQCFDVLEHLPNPAEQLLNFASLLTPEGRLIVNWYFFKGFEQEFPFHLDDPQQIDQFFLTLQKQFLEVFHPYFTTTRCYRPSPVELESGN